MSDFVNELNFDGDTFNDMKRDMNFILQRLLGNMQEKECQEGTLTLKLDVSLVREYVPNYNPNIPGESREIAKPKFSHKVTSQMKVEDMKKGNLDTEMELFLNEETGEYEMRPDRCKGFCVFQRMTAEAEKQKQEEKSNGKI